MKRTIIDNALGLHKASWWTVDMDQVRCELCPRACVIKDGERGFCGTRTNSGGILYSENYGRVTIEKVDAIEKKPIFHYMPGARVLSVGSYGCNLSCTFCQNHFLAHPDPVIPFTDVPPEALVQEAVEKGVSGIAFTFNEPIVWAEYIICVSKYAKKKGLSIIINSNGYIHGAAREELIGAVDALKVDIKGFTNDVYNELCSANMRPVLETCEIAYKAGKHLELSYILIPGKTDLPMMLGRFGSWVARMLEVDTPVHLVRFQPEYLLNQIDAATSEALSTARMELLSSGLKFVYMGGLCSDFGRDTICPECGRTWVERRQSDPEHPMYKGEKVSKFCPSYSDVRVHLKNGTCPGCGRRTNIVENVV